MPARTEIVRLALVSAAAISALVLSVAAGTPSAEDLPSISLAWPVLFHVERAVAVVSLVAAAALVGWRASRGELPSRIGQLEWRIAENAKWADDLRERVCCSRSSTEYVRGRRLKTMKVEASLVAMSHESREQRWPWESDPGLVRLVEEYRRSLPERDRRLEFHIRAAKGEIPRPRGWRLGSEAG